MLSQNKQIQTHQTYMMYKPIQTYTKPIKTFPNVKTIIIPVNQTYSKYSLPSLSYLHTCLHTSLGQPLLGEKYQKMKKSRESGCAANAQGQLRTQLVILKEGYTILLIYTIENYWNVINILWEKEICWSKPIVLIVPLSQSVSHTKYPLDPILLPKPL